MSALPAAQPNGDKRDPPPPGARPLNPARVLKPRPKANALVARRTGPTRPTSFRPPPPRDALKNPGNIEKQWEELRAKRAANPGMAAIEDRFGVPASLRISRVMHVITVACLFALPYVTPLPRLYDLGVIAFVVPMLLYEQSLVRADDLSQVKRAFDLNGYVGILYFIVLAVSIYVGK